MATTTTHPPCAGAPSSVPGLDEGLQDHYRALLAGLPWSGQGPSATLGTLGVTSCQSGEGVSTVAAHLAVTAARSGSHPVLLVDANDARPSVHRTFGVPPDPGLADVLLDEAALPAAVHASPVPNLSLLTAGRPGAPAPAGPEPDLLAQVVHALKADFALVVFDLPAGGAAGRLAGLLDGVLLVVEAERVRWEVVRRHKDLLAQAGAPLLGAVLNKRRLHVPGWLYRLL